MGPYDSTKRYFGPDGSALCKLIPTHPPDIPQLEDVFNRSGYHHDGGYEGTKSWWRVWYNKQSRHKVDVAFLDNMLAGIDQYLFEDKINREEADEAIDFAYTAYTLVRAGGWAFYKTSEGQYGY
jgi:hypothetical protein